jgi:hypothetical protein
MSALPTRRQLAILRAVAAGATLAPLPPSVSADAWLLEDARAAGDPVVTARTLRALVARGWLAIHELGATQRAHLTRGALPFVGARALRRRAA